MQLNLPKLLLLTVIFCHIYLYHLRLVLADQPYHHCQLVTKQYEQPIRIKKCHTLCMFPPTIEQRDPSQRLLLFGYSYGSYVWIDVSSDLVMILDSIVGLNVHSCCRFHCRGLLGLFCGLATIFSEQKKN